MLKKLGFFLMIIGCFVIFPIFTQAADKHVTDCLENEEGCLEEPAQEPVQQNDSDEKQLTDEDPFKSSSLLFNFVKMGVALLLVLALIYLLLLFIKKRNRLFNQVNVLENVGGISVGQNKSIQIVRIGSKMYLVGVGDNVELLEELTDEEVKEALLNKEENSLQPSTFLHSFFQKKTDPKKQLKNEQPTDDFTDTLQKELSKIKVSRQEIINQYEKKDDGHV